MQKFSLKGIHIRGIKIPKDMNLKANENIINWEICLNGYIKNKFTVFTSNKTLMEY